MALEWIVPAGLGLLSLFGGGKNKGGGTQPMQIELLNRPSDYRNVNPYSGAGYAALANMMNFGLQGFQGASQGLSSMMNPYGGAFQSYAGGQQNAPMQALDPSSYGYGPMAAWNPDGSPNNPDPRYSGPSQADLQDLVDSIGDMFSSRDDDGGVAAQRANKNEKYNQPLKTRSMKDREKRKEREEAEARQNKIDEARKPENRHGPGTTTPQWNSGGNRGKEKREEEEREMKRRREKAQKSGSRRSWDNRRNF